MDLKEIIELHAEIKQKRRIKESLTQSPQSELIKTRKWNLNKDKKFDLRK